MILLRSLDRLTDAVHVPYHRERDAPAPWRKLCQASPIAIASGLSSSDADRRMVSRPR